MRWRTGWVIAALLGAPVLAAATPSAPPRERGLGIELWTDRGNDAVYQPGQTLQVRTRTSDDAFLLVYEIDAEGSVRALFPDRGSSGFVEGQRTYRIPPESAEVELVVQGPVGQGYIVAITSREAFRELPWYLRPYDAQAEGVGYEGDSVEEEGVTSEGRVVGDPFVAMERIRRRVLANPEDAGSFASAYTSYYVHHEVRYPRYLCNDCHRPHQWAWWDGYDPYYATCAVFDFRVNWGWYWGPSTWFGSVPYYYYVYRPDCPPRYRVTTGPRTCYSSWNGWGRWRTLWGSRLTRYKSDPPSGYVPPSKFKDGGVWGDGKPAPAGFLVRDDGERVRHRPLAFVPIGRGQPWRGGRLAVAPEVGDRDPRRALRREVGTYDRPRIIRPLGRAAPSGDDGTRILRPGERAEPTGRDRPSLDRRGERPAYRDGHPRVERTPEPEDRNAPSHRDRKDGRSERSLRDPDTRQRERPGTEPPREERRREASRGERDEGGRGRGSRRGP